MSLFIEIEWHYEKFYKFVCHFVKGNNWDNCRLHVNIPFLDFEQATGSHIEVTYRDNLSLFDRLMCQKVRGVRDPSVDSVEWENRSSPWTHKSQVKWQEPYLQLILVNVQKKTDILWSSFFKWREWVVFSYFVYNLLVYKRQKRYNKLRVSVSFGFHLIKGRKLTEIENSIFGTRLLDKCFTHVVQYVFNRKGLTTNNFWILIII